MFFKRFLTPIFSIDTVDGWANDPRLINTRQMVMNFGIPQKVYSKKIVY